MELLAHALRTSSILPLILCITSITCSSEIATEVARQITKGFCKCPIYSKPVDCEEVLESGNTASGIYTIWPRSRLSKCETLKVYCDMKTDGGGWTVIQKRGNFGNTEDYFHRKWIDYKTGFGKLRKEFWIGNDNIFAITNQKSYAVRFDMQKKDGTKGFAQYEAFWIEDEERNYRLHLLGFSGGNAGDALSPHHLKEFYTEDKPNIPEGRSTSGPFHKGGWWYKVFPSSNLNGLNKASNFQTKDGIVWNPFGDYDNSLASTEIKVRSISF